MALKLSEVLLTELADDCIETILLNEESYAEEEIKQLMVNEDIFLLRAKRAAANPGFCEQIVNSYSERAFIKEFRIGKDLFRELSHQFGQSDIYQNLLRGYGLTPTSPEKHMMTFLYYVGDDTSSFREVANRFDLCLQTMHAIITRVCLFLSNMSSQVITWPTSERKAEIIAHYTQNKNMPGVIGSLGATHISIDKPYTGHSDYFNSHFKYSVILQGICDHEKNFIDIFVGYQGSFSKAKVFENSPIYEKLPDLCDYDCYLLADEAYPCLRNCLTPYKDPEILTDAHTCFNHLSAACRSDISDALVSLKRRFRRLYHLKLRGRARIDHVVRACCVLHNLSGARGDERHFEPPQKEAGLGGGFEVEGAELQTGLGQRDRLATELYDAQRETVSSHSAQHAH